jgi:glyoxylase-like metal-dependent hydrolase (beta-lactamase superfamily II)
MHWERLSEDVYVFTSDRYAQVTASLIVSGTIGVVIDALPFPQETSQIAYFARRRCPDGVRYVIYTQHQADHTYGAFLFPKAEVISHTLCREILLEKGVKSLEQAKAMNHELELVRLRIPTLTFDHGTFTLRMPGKTLDLFPTPGHTPDAISVILQEEKILFAGDTIMAIPTIGDGDLTQLRESTEAIAAMPLESIVQGHGEIILRGEIKDNIRRSLNYLEQLDSKVRKIVESGGTLDEARTITIESCGLQRVLLNGMVTQLHTANVVALYQRLKAQLPPVKHIVARKIIEATPEATPQRKPRTAKKTAAKKKTAEKKSDRKTSTKTVTKRSAATKRRTS